jgi:hypothetical protein
MSKKLKKLNIKGLSPISNKIIGEIQTLKSKQTVKYREPNLDVLHPYLEKFQRKYMELDISKMNYQIERSFIETRSENLPCLTRNILDYLNKNKEALNEIFIDFEFSEHEKKSTIEFLSKVNNNNDEFCNSWINQHGKLLSRGIYNLLRMSKIPSYFLGSMEIPSLSVYGEFSSGDIRSYVESFIDQNINVKVNFNSIDLNFSFKTNKDLGEKELHKKIKRCLILAHYHDIKEKIEIEFLDTKNKKVLPKKYKLLGPKEINSGSTSFGSSKEVSIWRGEESDKVTLHELIHYHNLDFHHRSNNEPINILISQNFNIDPNIDKLVNEAYTEIWGNLFNLMMVACEIKDLNHHLTLNELFSRLYKLELYYSLFQVSKILDFFGFKDIDDFVKPYDINNNNIKFEQSTSVFSYFFIKTALLFNLETFIQFVQSNLHDIRDIYSIKLKGDSLNNFMDLILNLAKNREYLDTLNYFMKMIHQKRRISKTKTKKRSNRKTNKKITNTKLIHKYSNHLKNTLRMTCIESI